MRGLILAAMTLTVVLTSVSMRPSAQTVDEVQSRPVMVPYTNMTVEEYGRIQRYRQEHTVTNRLECVGLAEHRPQYIYLGEWTTTGYCACPECCGEWATGYTASGTLARSEHTVACGCLPFGTQIVIDGIIYTVEDTGVEGEWVDIFFDTHDEALNYGMRTKEVYLVA